MGWRHPIRDFQQRLREDVRADLLPLQQRVDAVRNDVTDLATVLMTHLATVIDAQRETMEKLGELGTVLSARIDAASAQSEVRDDRLLLGLDAMAETVAKRVEEQGRRAVETIFASPGNYWGGQLATWMATPAGEAVRYAVEKSSKDKSITDNATRRKEAIEWAKRWLLEHRATVPPDNELGLMIEAAVLEMRTAPRDR